MGIEYKLVVVLILINISLNFISLFFSIYEIVL
jgi:hypothetical protein